MTCMPKPVSRCATRTPIRPRPRMPATLPASSTPVNFDRCHSPDLSEATACGTCRATASSKAAACSDALTMLELGAFTTITPALVAASTSTLSRPGPGHHAQVGGAGQRLRIDLRSAPDDHRVHVRQRWQELGAVRAIDVAYLE